MKKYLLHLAESEWIAMLKYRRTYKKQYGTLTAATFIRLAISEQLKKSHAETHEQLSTIK